MAHTGRHYELAFRRDLRMQVFDNNYAFPKTMLFTGSGFTGSAGVHFNTTDMPCEGGDWVDSLQSLVWTSPIVDVGPASYFLRVLAFITTGFFNNGGFECVRVGPTIVAESQSYAYQRPVPIIQPIFPGMQMQTPGVFEAVGFVSFGWRPKLW